MSGASGTSRGAPVAWVALALLIGWTTWLFARSATQIPLWYDESLTVRLSRLPLRTLWHALTAGFEFNPPLIYVATRAGRAMVQPELLGARLPGLLGYGLLVTGVFLFLRCRVGAWFALAGAGLLPLAEYAIRYAAEARAYMLLLGVSAFALVAWQATADRRFRMAPVFLTATVATAVQLHVWAILLPFALLAGETVEIVRTRSPRWRVILALIAASPALAIYPSLLRASRTIVFAGPVYAPSWDKLSAAFRSDIPRPRVVLAALAAAWIAGRVRRPDENAGHVHPGLTAAEFGAIGVLLLSPLVPYAYASAAAGAFMTRYALFGLPAVAILIAAALHRAGNAQRAAAVAAATVVLAGVWLYVPPKVPSAGSQNAALQSVAAASDRLAPGVPLVLVNPIDVTAVDEQADDALRRRFVYVADPALALQYTGTNGIDLGYLRGERYLNVQITRLSYEALVSGRDRLYLVGKEQSLSWLPQRLRDEGWTLTGVGGTRQAPIVEAARTRGPVATGAAKTG